MMRRRDLMRGMAACAMTMFFAACTGNGPAASGDDEDDEGRNY